MLYIHFRNVTSIMQIVIVFIYTNQHSEEMLPLKLIIFIVLRVIVEEKFGGISAILYSLPLRLQFLITAVMKNISQYLAIKLKKESKLCKSKPVWLVFWFCLFLQNEELTALALESRHLKDEIDILRSTADKVVRFFCHLNHNLLQVLLCNGRVSIQLKISVYNHYH